MADSTQSTKTAKPAISHLRLKAATSADQADEHRQQRGAAREGADGGDVGEERGPLGDDLLDRALIHAAEAEALDEHLRDDEPEQDRQAGQHDVAGEQRGEERGGRMRAAEQAREALGEPAGACPQHRQRV